MHNVSMEPIGQHFGTAHFDADTPVLLAKQESPSQIFLGDDTVVHYDQASDTGEDEVLDGLVSQRPERQEEDR